MNSRNCLGCVPLMYAAGSGHLQVVILYSHVRCWVWSSLAAGFGQLKVSYSTLMYAAGVRNLQVVYFTDVFCF